MNTLIIHKQNNFQFIISMLPKECPNLHPYYPPRKRSPEESYRVPYRMTIEMN